MTTFVKCVNDALKTGKIQKQKRDEAVRYYNNVVKDLKESGMSDEQAHAVAMPRAVERAQLEVLERAKRKVGRILALKRAEADIRAFKGDNPGDAVIALVEHDDRLPGVNYVSLRDVVRGQFHSYLADLIERYAPTAAGLHRPVQGLHNIIKELYGEATGDKSAAAYAKAWTDATDLGVSLWNMAGGSLMRRGDWRAPQWQNPVKLMKASKKTWVEHHMDWLDWEKMRRVDGSRIDAADRAKVLSDIFDTLKTDGNVGLGKNSRGRAALGNAFDQSRFMIFKDSASWLAMHERYGEGNIFEMMTTHLEDMAHKIAMLKRFGPNPSEMQEVVKALARKMAADIDAAQEGPMKKALSSKVEMSLAKFDDMFAVISRTTKMNPENSFGNFMAGTRNVIVSAVLGSASLLAVPTDLAMARIVRGFNRVPAAGGLRFYLRGMNPLDAEHRRQAMRSGLVNDNATVMAYASQRFTGLNTYGAAWTKRFADTVLRMSLLSGHTRAARWGASQELMGLLADDKGKALADLPYRAMLERYGITPEDWDVFRSIPSWEPEPGATFQRPADLLSSGVDRRLALAVHDKFMVMIVDESKTMIPDATVWALTTLRGASRPGTLSGELLSSFAMFKNFPVTIMNMYWRRAMIQGSMKGRVGFAVAMASGMTMAGALGLQLRELTQGRDPREMDDPAFWGQALLSGGGLGILGDFLFSGLNRFGQGLEETFAGPAISTMNDFRELTLGNLAQAYEGKPTNALPESLQFARRTLPGTSLWWARTALQRGVFDVLQDEIDPQAGAKRRRQMSNQKKHIGNEYWWRPGDFGPSRGPDFGHAFGGEQ